MCQAISGSFAMESSPTQEVFQASSFAGQRLLMLVLDCQTLIKKLPGRRWGPTTGLSRRTKTGPSGQRSLLENGES